MTGATQVEVKFRKLTLQTVIILPSPLPSPTNLDATRRNTHPLHPTPSSNSELCLPCDPLPHQRKTPTPPTMITKCMWSLFGCKYVKTGDGEAAQQALIQHEREHCLTMKKVSDESGRVGRAYSRLKTFMETEKSKGPKLAALAKILEDLDKEGISPKMQPVLFGSDKPDVGVPFLFKAGTMYKGGVMPSKTCLGGFLHSSVYEATGEEDAEAIQTSILTGSYTYGTIARREPFPLLNLTPSETFPRRYGPMLPVFASKTAHYNSATAYNALPPGSIKDLKINHGFSSCYWSVGGACVWFVYPAPLPKGYFTAFADCASQDPNAGLPMTEAMLTKLRKPWIGVSEEDVGIYIPPGAAFFCVCVEACYLGVAEWVEAGLVGFENAGKVAVMELEAFASVISTNAAGEDVAKLRARANEGYELTTMPVLAGLCEGWWGLLKHKRRTGGTTMAEVQELQIVHATIVKAGEGRLVKTGAASRKIAAALKGATAEMANLWGALGPDGVAIAVTGR